MKRNKLIGLAALAAMVVGTQTAGAREEHTTTKKTETGVLKAREIDATATITAIDTEKRKVTVENAQGDEITMTLGRELEGLDRVKVGDKVQVHYLEALAIDLKPSTERVPTAGVETVVREAQAGAVARRLRMTAEFMEWDAENELVSVKGPEKNTFQLKVTNPAMQKTLSGMEKGAAIELTYSEAVAMKIIPAV